ncbi:MAG: hypothetical protein AVO39_04835 [delta proteobacterium MLS_D]|jgi:AcrR family transcriptional regulator|nr:MAG: hypothetical protein AVO39_04835 [delta proteobacterium MLS_D]
MKLPKKKQDIVDAAFSVLSRKGKRATIAEIAGAAEVNESAIYYYFKDKRELLFYAAGESLRRRTIDLQRELEGISDPISRLSALIWFQLTYHDDEPGYARYSILDCRADREFFHHEASIHFINWTRIVNTILLDGINEGSFVPEIPFSVVNSMIMGLIDMENIQVFTGRWKGSARDDFDAILYLLLPVLTEPYSKKDGELQDERELILQAGERVFAARGVDQVKISDIVKESGLNQETVHSCFGSPENILLSVLRSRFAENRFRMPIAVESTSPSEKLVRFIREHFLFFLGEPSFVTIFLAGGMYNEDFYCSSDYEEYEAYLGTLDDILNEGKEKELFRSGVENRVFINLFNGCFSHLMIRWLNMPPRSHFETTRIMQWAVKLLLRAVEAPNG